MASEPNQKGQKKCGYNKKRQFAAPSNKTTKEISRNKYVSRNKFVDLGFLKNVMSTLQVPKNAKRFQFLNAFPGPPNYLPCLINRVCERPLILCSDYIIH